MEEVAAGEYSDDTQMAIAVVRARLREGGQWPRWLERVELVSEGEALRVALTRAVAAAWPFASDAADGRRSPAL